MYILNIKRKEKRFCKRKALYIFFFNWVKKKIAEIRKEVSRVFFLKRLKEKIEFFNSIFLILIRSKKKGKERNSKTFIYFLSGYNLLLFNCNLFSLMISIITATQSF